MNVVRRASCQVVIVRRQDADADNRVQPVESKQ